MAVYWVLVAAVGFLYAISCLIASNLALARMLGQRRELSIRLAMGSGRWRVVRLLVFESLILSVVGWRVFVLLGVLTIFTSLCIVVIPAYRILRTDICPGLKRECRCAG
ncbi:MAG TPA: FtsX-like permease family protein [Opitutus sp.]|nr:FtsX-like permease family protein [Opitutus sp.]